MYLFFLRNSWKTRWFLGAQPYPQEKWSKFSRAFHLSRAGTGRIDVTFFFTARFKDVTLHGKNGGALSLPGALRAPQPLVESEPRKRNPEKTIGFWWLNKYRWWWYFEPTHLKISSESKLDHFK